MGRSNTLTTGGYSLNAGLYFWEASSYSLVGHLTIVLDVLEHKILMDDATFNASGYNVTIPNFEVYDATVYMGSGTWNITSGINGGYAWRFNGDFLFCETSTLILSDTTSTEKGFRSDGQTYNIVTIAADNVYIEDGCTIGTLNINTAGMANGLKLNDGSTITVTDMTSNGSAGSLAKLVSYTADTPTTISKTSGVIAEDYLSLKDITATGGAAWYAGSHSTNVSGNSGWIFRNGIGPNGITPATAFGSPAYKLSITLTGINTTDFGIPRVIGSSIVPTSIAPATAFGSPTVLAAALVTLTGFANQSSFGAPSFFSVQGSATSFSVPGKSRTNYVPGGRPVTSYSNITKQRTSYAD
jgi:hypothetical protein